MRLLFRSALVAAACAVIVPAGGPAAGEEGAAPSCRADASTPRIHRANGLEYVRSTHTISCTRGVGHIEVWGRLLMNGRIVDERSSSCAGPVTGCAVGTIHVNPTGQQRWQGRTGGSFRWGGERHAVTPVTSSPAFL